MWGDCFLANPHLPINSLIGKVLHTAKRDFLVKEIF